MADPLREKLKALVGDLHEQAALYRRGQESSNSVQALAYTQCARKLTALLAESEPCTVQECKDLGQCACFREPDMVASAPGDRWVGHVSRSHPSHPHEIVDGSINGFRTHYQGDSCPGGHESKCGYCGAPCGWCSIEQRCPHGAGDGMCPVLGCGNYPEPKPVLKLGHEFLGCYNANCSEILGCHDCGQPREAH